MRSEFPKNLTLDKSDFIPKVKKGSTWRTDDELAGGSNQCLLAEWDPYERKLHFEFENRILIPIFGKILNILYCLKSFGKLLFVF